MRGGFDTQDEGRTDVTYAGIRITDTDSLFAAADLIEEEETRITCPECDGARSITDSSPGLGYIDI